MQYQSMETGVRKGEGAVMTSIFSMVIVFMATFLLVFVYLTYPEQETQQVDAQARPVIMSHYIR